MSLPSDDTIPMLEPGTPSPARGVPAGQEADIAPPAQTLTGGVVRTTRSGRSTPRLRKHHRRTRVPELPALSAPRAHTHADVGPDATTLDEPTTLPEDGEGDASSLDSEITAALRDASDRFRFRRKVGMGGFGEVWEAWDNRLNRKVAVKLLRPRWGADGRFVDLLRQEARVASQLLHPAIVAVHDLGILADGHPFIVMEYVEGQPWHEVYTTSHGHIPDPASAFSSMLQLVEGLAFGHAREVAHRDIKPGNVLVSTERLAGREASRVRIVDWGLACLVEDPHNLERGAFVHRQVGTPAYLAPEIAAGGAASLTADVYSVGVMLHELLWGHRPPQPGKASPVSRLQIGDRRIAEICEECLALDPRERVQRADVLLRRLRDWWRSWVRSEEVADVVARADQLERQADDVRGRAQRLLDRVTRLREHIHPSAPEEDKLSLWTLEDDLRQSRDELHRLESDRMAALLGALAIDPRSERVRRRLAEIHRDLHEAAEDAGDSGAAARHLAALSTFDDGMHADYIHGAGTICVAAQVPNVDIEVRHLVTVRRRLVVGSVAWTGPAGTVSTPILPGRYQVRATAPGHHPAEVCVRVGRSQRWTNTLPGTGEVRPIELMPKGSVRATEAYVAGGPHLVGAHDRMNGALPAREVWTDSFIIRRLCVTVAEYISFLDDLVRQGRAAEALDRAPQQRGAADDVPLYLFGQREDGTFYARPDADGDPVYEDHPVTLIRPRDAEAFAGWLAERTGQPWRLPFELEWEKAARSADGRKYPFGDHIDASWVRCLEYHPPGTRLAVARVGDHPADRSALGVAQMAGNVFEMTASIHQPDGPIIRPDGTWSESPCAPEESRVLRGGAWGRDITRCMASHRTVLGDHRTPLVGFRLVRSVRTDD